MAILITQVKVDEVPDDRLPEISGEVCQPYNVEWYRLPTRKEVETGNFEMDGHTGEPMPVKDRHVIFMSEDVQHKLGMLHETWAWLCCQYVEQGELLNRRRQINIGLMDRLKELTDWYVGAPWYKRVWRALWIRN